MLKPCFSRWFYLSQALLIGLMLGFACFLQFFKGVMPCTLCEMQRLIFVLLAIVLLVGALLPHKKLIIPHILTNLGAMALALFGMLFASRQVWLEHFPPAYNPTSTCGTNLWYLFKIMPFSDVLLNVFFGGRECARVSWQFLKISLAGWAFIWFSVFLLLAFIQVICRLFFSRKYR